MKYLFYWRTLTLAAITMSSSFIIFTDDVGLATYWMLGAIFSRLHEKDELVVNRENA